MYNNFKRYSEMPIKKDNEKINVCIFHNDNVPFDLRLASVFDIISKNEKFNFCIVFPNDYDNFKKDIKNNLVNFDYIILQRNYYDFEIANLLIEKSKILNFKIIYEIDDDLIHIDESNPQHDFYWGIQNQLEHIISNADLVTVTTENLKQQLAYLNNNITVIPNRLGTFWFKKNYGIKKYKPNNIIKIGYIGSIRHSWDLILIEKSIKRVKDYFLKKKILIIFELIGGTTEHLDFTEQIEVPDDKQHYFEFIDWYKNTVDWDIAIAPLESSNLNLTKSELKYLEYAVLGIPGVYSNIGPYANNIENEKNGLLVYDNTSDEWAEKIIRLIEDESLQKTIIKNSYNDVISNYLIEDSVNDWLKIFEENINGIKFENSFKSIKKEIFSYYPINTGKERILLVGHSGDYGGSEILLKNMIAEFKKQDMEVAVFVKSDGPIIGEYKKMAPTFIVDTNEKIVQYTHELSMLNFESAILNTAVTGNFISTLKKHDFYVISLVHELPGVIKYLKLEKFSKEIADYADLVVFPSKFVANKFENMFKVRNLKLIHSQGFYNMFDEFDRTESRRILENKHDIPENNQIILNVGRGEKRKGFDIFIDVSEKLKNENLTFIWVGCINKNIQQEFSNQINNSENLIATGFISDKKEIMRYYDACDIFLLTSYEDPFPSVVMEAFNAKKPVIAFENAGGLCDIVINDFSGYLVEYGSSDALVEKIKFLVNNNALKEELGNNAKTICESLKFDEYVKILKSYCINGKIMIMNNKISDLNNEISKFKTENEKLKTQNKKLSKLNQEILSSSSWKITEPLRNLKHAFKK